MKNLTKITIFSLSLIFSTFNYNKSLFSQTSLSKVEEIHQQVLTVDSQIDWPARQLRNPSFNPAILNTYGEENSGQWDLVRMKQGGLDVIFMSIYTSQKERTNEGHIKAKKTALQLIEITQEMIKNNSDKVELALNPTDAYRLEKEGKGAIFLGMENGYPLGKDIDNVEFFFNQGIRYITLTHFLNNEIGDSSTDQKQEWNGLSPFGEEVVKKMNQLGIMIDISHVHDDTFWDVIKLTKAPIIASHSSAKALRNHPRNMDEEMLKAIAKNGGVVQVCLLDNYIKEIKQNPEREKALAKLATQIQALRNGELNSLETEELMAQLRQIEQQFPKQKPTIADAVDHIDYMVKIMGIDHVGIGSDFDGGGGLKGLEDVSKMPKITEELLRRGYSLDDIEKIWGGNLMRVFTEVQNVAANIH